LFASAAIGSPVDPSHFQDSQEVGIDRRDPHWLHPECDAEEIRQIPDPVLQSVSVELGFRQLLAQENQ
jgi:hypothetical protein